MKDMCIWDIVRLIVSILLCVGVLVCVIRSSVHLLLSVYKMKDFDEENDNKCP